MMISYKELPEIFVEVKGLTVRKVPKTRRLLNDFKANIKSKHYNGYQAAAGAETELARIQALRRVASLVMNGLEERMIRYTNLYVLHEDDILLEEYCGRTVAEVMADVRAGVDVLAKCREIQAAKLAAQQKEKELAAERERIEAEKKRVEEQMKNDESDVVQHVSDIVDDVKSEDLETGVQADVANPIEGSESSGDDVVTVDESVKVKQSQDEQPKVAVLVEESVVTEPVVSGAVDGETCTMVVLYNGGSVQQLCRDQEEVVENGQDVTVAMLGDDVLPLRTGTSGDNEAGVVDEVSCDTSAGVVYEAQEVKSDGNTEKRECGCDVQCDDPVLCKTKREEIAVLRSVGIDPELVKIARAGRRRFEELQRNPEAEWVVTDYGLYDRAPIISKEEVTVLAEEIRDATERRRDEPDDGYDSGGEVALQHDVYDDGGTEVPGLSVIEEELGTDMTDTEAEIDDVAVEEPEKVLRDLFPMTCVKLENHDGTSVECTVFTSDIPYRAKNFRRVRDKSATLDLRDISISRAIEYVRGSACVDQSKAVCGPPMDPNVKWKYDSFVESVDVHISGSRAVDWKRFAVYDDTGFKRIVPAVDGLRLDDCEFYTQDEIGGIMTFMMKDIDLKVCSERERLHYMLLFAKLWNQDIAGRGAMITSLQGPMLTTTGRSVSLLSRVFERLIEFIRAGCKFKVLSRVEGFKRMREMMVSMLTLYSVRDDYRQVCCGFGFSHLMITGSLCDRGRRRVLYDADNKPVDVHWYVETDYGVTVSYANTTHVSVIRVYYCDENVYVVHAGADGRNLMMGPYATRSSFGNDNNFVIKNYPYVPGKRGSPVVSLDGQVLGVLLGPGNKLGDTRVMGLVMRA